MIQCPVFQPSISPFTMYLDPSIYVHLNDLFFDTTAPTVLKFHKQNDQTAGLQTGKIQPGQGPMMATDTKSSTSTKVQFFLQNGLECLAEILTEVLVGPWSSMISK